MTEPSTPLAPFPRLPPPPEDPGEYLTFFGADMPKPSFDRNGNLVLQLIVNPEDKYKAMPLTDIRGRRFHITVHAPHGRHPLVAADSTLAVYAAQDNSRTRRRNRRWERAKSTYFTGENE